MKEKVGIEIKNLRVTNVEEGQRREPKNQIAFHKTKDLEENF